MSSLLIDIILLAIIAICIFIGSRKGAVKVLLSLAAFVVAAYLAYSLSTPFATFINNKFVEPSIINSVESAISDTAQNFEDVLPDFIVKNADSLGISLNTDSIINASDFVQKSISPSVIKLISSIALLVMFIIFAVVLNFLATIVNKIIKVSFLGKINKLLGGIFGALTGCIIIIVLCFVLKYTVYLSGEEAKLISNEALQNSFIYKTFIDIF
ncbi:MAG: CvpA family protein [Acutalibacteraceae bacterium]|nr:CvpA family protein [Acutalibacteraceae bacterium]